MISRTLAAACVVAGVAAAGGRLSSKPVKGLCSDPVAQEAGYYDIDGGLKSYFYWSFASRNTPASDPVVMWLTGGPGCSSLLALSSENGPCLADKSGQMRFNQYGWNQNATLIYVDQPAGVGFSYGLENDSNETGVATDLLAFLQDWFAAHPALANNPFYVFAESYGGHYAPAISYAIYANNLNPIPGTQKINLQGVGIGNGLTKPTVQYAFYPQLAYNYTQQVLGTPVISLATYEQMTADLATCLPMIAACQNDTTQCGPAQSFCNNAEIGPYEQTGLNPYNFLSLEILHTRSLGSSPAPAPRTRAPRPPPPTSLLFLPPSLFACLQRIACAVPPLCYDESPSTTFYNNASTLAALGVRPQSAAWTSCNFNVNGDFSNDWMRDFDGLVAPQLEAGIRFVVYSGELDFIVNWLGGKAWTLAMDWSGQAAFNAAADRPWLIQGTGEKAGEVRSSGGLSFIKVYNGGHMVPLDVPFEAQQLLLTFITGKPF